MKNANIDAIFNVAHLNVRKEKAGEDDGPTACDVKLKATLGVAAVKGLFGTSHSFETVLGNLWTSKGEMASSDVQEITLNRQLTGCRVALKPEADAGESFDGCDLNKIRLKPIAGNQVEVSMRLQCRPDEEQFAWLAKRLNYDVRVTASVKQGSLDLQPKAEAGAVATH